MSRLRLLLLLAALTGLYYLAGKVGLEFFGLLNPSASAVWPPTGVAIAALLIFGYRVAPAVFLGALLVNVTTAGSLASSLGIAAGNTLEGIAAAYLVRRFAAGRDAFDHARDVFKFAGLAAVASTALSATLGVAILLAGGLAERTQLGELWLTWWLGDASGAILVAPLLLLWYRDRRVAAPAARVLEAALLFATVIATNSLLFFNPLLNRYPLAFLGLPPLVWAAFRFGQREVATAAAAMSLIATWATMVGRGPFTMASPNESLLVLQSFTVMIAMTALVMSALVQERLALLRRERAALAEAQSALRASDVFLATVSHELRNPLSAIGASAAVLDQPDVARDDIARAGRIIKRQTAHFKRLIDDLLDVTRVTVGKMTLHRRPLDLADAVTSATQALTPHGERRMSRIALHLSSVWVDADPDRMFQVIANLLANSLKYTQPDGEIHVHVLEERGDAVLRIEDSGSGIAPELLPRVFDLFVQGEQGPDRAHGGLGVGLTLVRRLVELHGGSVEARSAGAGRGSTFVVRLPRCAAPPGLEPSPSIASAAPRAYRILLIEDNADARESLKILLERAGHELHEAPDGETGVERALERRPHVALVDLGLPGIDGCEVARRIKATEPSIRLVALTGYGSEEDRVRSRQAGFDAHVVKPVMIENLEIVMDGLVAPGDARADRRGPD